MAAWVEEDGWFSVDLNFVRLEVFPDPGGWRTRFVTGSGEIIEGLSRVYMNVEGAKNGALVLAERHLLHALSEVKSLRQRRVTPPRRSKWEG